MALQTEYNFTLPRGYIDEEGSLHKDGVMRLATTADKILSQRDSRVQNNHDYLMPILLSRVVVRLGQIDNVSLNIIENLFLDDFN